MADGKTTGRARMDVLMIDIVEAAIDKC